MMKTAMLGSVLVALAGRAASMGVHGTDYDSFEQGVPTHFTATRPESLSVTPWHYRHGTNSLRWDWNKGEALVVHHDIGDPTRTGGFLNRAAFVVWVHMENPVPDALLFTFWAGDRVTGSFRFPLQFRGWRQARLFYDTFPKGRPTADVDSIRIEAPVAVQRGTTFFDVFRYNTLVYYSASINPEEVAGRHRRVPDEERFPRPARVTDEERAALRRLRGDAMDGRAAGPGIKDMQVSELMANVAALGIARDEHGVRGPSLVRSGFYYAAPGEYGAEDIKIWPDEYGPAGIEIGQPSPDPVIRLADKVATAYRESQDDRQRANLLDIFAQLSAYLLDEGLSISLDTIIRMRDVPEVAKDMEAHLESVHFSLRANSFFVDEDTPVEANMDFYASSGPYRLQNMLRLCFATGNDAEQVRWLNAWKSMFERSLLQPGASFKPDGSAYHHHGHYPSYAQNAFARLPPLLAEVHGTPWYPSAEALQPFRRAMLAQRLYWNKLNTPIALAGRSPFEGGIYEGVLRNFGDAAFDVVARLGSPDGRQRIDPEMAAVYLRLVPEAIDKEPYRGLGIEPEPDPQGTFVMPYAALLLHRRDNWLASVKGQSEYCWGSERQARRNAFGLFQGLGNLEILAGGDPVSAAESGRQGSGWDWRRFEGVTSPQLPLAEIDSGWSFVSGTIRSPETFVGGLSHQNRHGVFAMILNLPIAPGRNSLTGRKSWFFEDGHIVCLGSDISYIDARHPTQTTLCQKGLSARQDGAFLPTPLDGTEFAAFPEERVLASTTAHWFLDVQQTGYYLPAGQNVTVARWRQKSRDVNDAQDTAGNFLTAWIDHGHSPSWGRYEYALAIRSDSAAMKRFVASPPYQVVRQEADAHIVRFVASGRWGAAYFAPRASGSEPADVPIRAVDRPCLVMAEPERDGRLELTVADPDLNMKDGVSMPRPLRLTLHGNWRLLRATGVLCAWQSPEVPVARVLSVDTTATVLEIACRHGASYGLSLAK